MAVVNDSGFMSLEGGGWSMFYVCIGDVMDVVFSVRIVMYGAVGTRVWEI